MRILISRTDAIGDLLLTLPIIPLIKLKYPNAYIGLIHSSRTKPLIPFISDVDEFILFEKETCKSKIKDFKAEWFFFFGGSLLPLLYAFLCHVPNRGGLKSRLLTYFLLNFGIRQKRSCLFEHESKLNSQLLAPLGIQYSNEELNYQLRLNDTKKIEAQSKWRILFRKTEGCKKIIIHPGMSGHTLNWSSDNYWALVCELIETSSEDLNILISFTPSDEKYISACRLGLENMPELKNKVVFYDGSEYGLEEYIYLLSQADLFVGPSTGTLHLANFLHLPVVGIYSPVDAQCRERWGPALYHSFDKIFSPEYDKHEYSHQNSNDIRLAQNKMNDILPKEVSTTILEILYGEN